MPRNKAVWATEQTIDQPRFQAWPPSCLFPSELKEMVFTAIRS